jgi:CRISPR-associated protein Csd1
MLNRLYELAVREKLQLEPAFEQMPVPYVIILDEGGKWLPPIMEQRGEIITVKKTRKGTETKSKPDKGMLRSIPRPHGNTASQGFARYFVDTLPRVLPVEIEEEDRQKVERSRVTFWEQISYAADATNDPALRAIEEFGRKLALDESLAEKVRNEVGARKADGGDRVTFAYHPHGGPTILEWKPIREWYASFFRQFTVEKQAGGRIGFCTLTGSVGPLPTCHSIKLTGIPGGLPTGVSIVSFDKGAFQHYGLDGAANAAISYEGADGYACGFQWLRNHREHSFVIGGTLFLFWTRKAANTDFILALQEASAEDVRALLESVSTGRPNESIEDVDDFYMLAVSGNSARAIIRDYLERRLGQVRDSIIRWFNDLRIADLSKEHQGRANAAFPLWMLANATALESDRVAPDTHARLMHAALTSGPVPDSILAACIARLRIPERDPKRPQFSSSRMALIKLCLNRTHCLEENAMPESLDLERIHDQAYLCGCLLAFLARCQSPKDFGTSAQIVERFFGSAMQSPRAVFPTLIKLNRHHISIIRGQQKGFAFKLEQELDALFNLLRPEDGELPDFKSTHTLAEQGRFALGFYQQRAEYRRISADKKLEAAVESVAE